MDFVRSELQLSRSVVDSPLGLVASGHELSAEAGGEILRDGGNAFDAAAAAIFASWVVEPESCGLGGLGRGIVYHAESEQVRVLSSTGRVPAAATEDMFVLEEGLDPWGRWRKVKENANMIGPRSPMIPGMLAGICAVLDDFGTLPLGRLLEPAIGFAKDGIEIDGYTTLQIASNLTHLLAYPETAAIFAPDGVPLKPGAMHQAGSRLVQEDLAVSLEHIGTNGPDVFYGGELAAKIEGHLQSIGGILTAADLASYRPDFRAPERTGSYRGTELVWSDGFFANLILNVLENFDLQTLEPGSPQYYHLLIEATRFSFASLLANLADPLVRPSPLTALWSKEYAAEIAGRIDTGRAAEKPEAVNPWPTETRLTGRKPPNQVEQASGQPIDPGTSQVVVVDSAGNVATFNMTHSGPFGSMVTVPGTGILLNGAMTSMDPEPGKVHSIHPKRRHLGFSAPVLALSEGRPYFAFSASGGRSVITCQVQVVCGIVDYGLSAQQAIELPRMHCELGPTRIDRHVGRTVIAELRKLGHDLDVVAETFYAPYFARPVCVEADRERETFRSGISQVHRTAATALR